MINLLLLCVAMGSVIGVVAGLLGVGGGLTPFASIGPLPSFTSARAFAKRWDGREVF